MSGQLIFDFAFPPVATLDSYHPSGNELLVDLLDKFTTLQGEDQIFLWGDGSVGKTHLLQAICHIKGKAGFQVAYLPIKMLVKNGPDFLEGFEQIPLICIDDIHVLAGDADWEEALFDLINRIRESGGQLLIAAEKAPVSLFDLPDLLSRLTWGPVLKVAALDEDGIRSTLLTRAEALRMKLSEEVINYLLVHYSRSIAVQLDCLSQLAESSLIQQRILTLPFVRETLKNYECEKSD